MIICLFLNTYFLGEVLDGNGELVRAIQETDLLTFQGRCATRLKGDTQQILMIH